jgi:O-antigen/teichoic acid export membrane protein
MASGRELNLTTTDTRPKHLAQTASIHKGAAVGRNFVWIALGHASYGLMQWGIIVVFANAGNPATVGTFTLAGAIVIPIVLFTNMQLRAVQASDATDEFPFPDYFSLRLIGTLIAFIAAVIVGLTMGYPPYVITAIALLSAIKLVESLNDVIYGFMQKRECFASVSVSLLRRSFGALAVIAIVMYTTQSLVFALLAQGVLWVVLIMRHDVRAAQWLLSKDAPGAAGPRSWFRFDGARLRSLAKLALPLGVVTMLISLNLNIPRFVVERELGLRKLGYFGALLYPAMAGNLAVFAFGESTLPRLSRAFVGNVKEFLRIWGLLLAVAALLGAIATIVVIVAGESVLGLLYDDAYRRYAPAFAWLMLGTGLGWIGSANGYALTAARDFGVQVPLFLITAATTLVSSLVLVPRTGLVGAAQAMAIAGLVYVVLAGSALALVVSRRSHGTLDA